MVGPKTARSDCLNSMSQDKDPFPVRKELDRLFWGPMNGEDGQMSISGTGSPWTWFTVTLEDTCVNDPYSPTLQLCLAFLLCPEDEEGGDEMNRVASKQTYPVDLSSLSKNPYMSRFVNSTLDSSYSCGWERDGVVGQHLVHPHLCLGLSSLGEGLHLLLRETHLWTWLQCIWCSYLWRIALALELLLFPEGNRQGEMNPDLTVLPGRGMTLDLKNLEEWDYFACG